jgi:hypothetical protein
MWVILFLFQLAILSTLLSENRRSFHKDLRFWLSLACLGVTAGLVW